MPITFYRRIRTLFFIVFSTTTIYKAGKMTTSLRRFLQLRIGVRHRLILDGLILPVGRYGSYGILRHDTRNDLSDVSSRYGTHTSFLDTK